MSEVDSITSHVSELFSKFQSVTSVKLHLWQAIKEVIEAIIFAVRSFITDSDAIK